MKFYIFLKKSIPIDFYEYFVIVALNISKNNLFSNWLWLRMENISIFHIYC